MILQSKVVLPPVGNVSLLVNNIPVRVEGLLSGYPNTITY